MATPRTFPPLESAPVSLALARPQRARCDSRQLSQPTLRREATRGSRVRLPLNENARSRHQRLFEENVRKTEKRCGLRTLSVKGSWVVFMHGERISTPRVRHKGRKPSIKCANMTSKLCISPLFTFLCLFCIFLSFCGRQGCFPCSYVFLNCDKEIRPLFENWTLVKLFLSFFAIYILTEQKSFKALDHLNDLLILLKGEKR